MSKSAQDAKTIIDQQPICTLITVDENSAPVERAMFTAKVDKDLTIYFGTHVDSHKARQIAANCGVVVVWPIDKGFLAVQGNAELLYDQPVKDHVWHTEFASHFPGGSSDPNFVVIKVCPVVGSFYQAGTMEPEEICLG
ncbi:MAG TPA: pyridoxamine 5'-phosphate oxidase family protein [Armatimonadota bacterium]